MQTCGWCEREHMPIFSGLDAHFISCGKGVSNRLKQLSGDQLYQAVAVRKLQQVNAATTLDFCVCRRAIGWSNYQVIGRVSTASASMINSACALCGRRETLVRLKLLITIGEVAMKREIPLAHPGEILLEGFLRPMGITQYRLANSTTTN